MGGEEILMWQNHPRGHLYIIVCADFPEQAACHLII